MGKCFWITGFLALGLLSVSPVLPLKPGEPLRVSGSASVSKISIAGHPEPGSKAPGAGTTLKMIGDIEVVRTQVDREEKDLPKDGDERLDRLINLARLYFLLGDLGAKNDDKPGRQKYYEKGRHFAELLSREHPQRVEGHYWLALNLLGLAAVGRAGQALKTLPIIIQELNLARDLDEAYDQAGPHRILGRLYCKAPPWPMSVGDLNMSLEVLCAAVRIAPENSTNHLFLAETLLQMHKNDEAFLELEKVLSSTSHSVRPQGLEEDRRDAIGLIKKYKKA